MYIFQLHVNNAKFIMLFYKNCTNSAGSPKFHFCCNNYFWLKILDSKFDYFFHLPTPSRSSIYLYQYKFSHIFCITKKYLPSKRTIIKYKLNQQENNSIIKQNRKHTHKYYGVNFLLTFCFWTWNPAWSVVIYQMLL